MKKSPLFILLFCLAAALQMSCSPKKQEQIKQKVPLAMEFNNGDYLKEWQEIEELDRKRRPKTALEKVNALYTRAKADKNPAQVLKTIIYRGKYESELEEDGLVNAIYKMQQEAESADFPVKQLMQSILAELYQKYLNSNLWKIRDRTTTADSFKQEDIRTWDISRLYDESARLYQASVENDALQQVDIKNFKAIMTKEKNTGPLRPTLYDFLAHRALDYFMNGRSQLNEPNNKYYIKSSTVFGSVDTFLEQVYKTSDPTSHKYQALLLFKKLLRFHKNDKDSAALIDADLKRLEYMRDNAIVENKGDLYFKALEALYKKHEKHASSTEVAAKIAYIYMEQGAKYNKELKDDPNQWGYKKAMGICRKAVTTFPKSYGAAICGGIIADIERKHLSTQVESINVPNKPYLFRLDYRNIPKVHARIIALSEEEREGLMSLEQQPAHQLLMSKKVIESLSIDLPDDGDYQSHGTELKAKALDLGHYVLVLSDDADFGYNKTAFTFTPFTVSNMSYFKRGSYRAGGEWFFIVTDRDKGTPIEGVKAEFSLREYNSRSRKYEYKKIGESYSNKDGFVYPKRQEGRRNHFTMRLSKGKDILNAGENFSINSWKNDRSSRRTHFFLDRAIYRPGQTVYFKGLAIEKNGEGMPRILSNEKTTVTLLDANHQKLKSLELKTNEYGTFTGTFQAPEGGLLGRMGIRSTIGNDEKSFRVEEYKRPKFELAFDPVKGSFRLGDQVEVTGTAKALAGINIDNAKVQYRVVRAVSFPYWRWWSWGWNPYQSTVTEIVNGESMTDEKGIFKIAFEAKPDLSIPKDKKPQFKYEVYVDVTDINGETRSSQTNVNVGYLALNAGFNIPNEVYQDSFQNIQLFSKNLNGTFEPAQGKLTVTALTAPKQLFIDRYWQKPDKYILTENDYAKIFPHYAYKGNDEAFNWPKGKVLLDINFDTGVKKEIALNKAELRAGTYLAVLNTKDKFGGAIEQRKTFVVYDEKTPVKRKMLNVTLSRSSYEPGESAELFFSSIEETMPFYYEILHHEKILRKGWETLKGIKKIQLPILEAYRGGVDVYMASAKNNRGKVLTRRINVPWTNKDLKIEYATFRDKLQPGQEEEWQIKISGSKGEKVAAEMLATMYDASLDQFAKNQWSLNLFPGYSAQLDMRAHGFGTNSSRLFAKNWQPDSPDRQYREYAYLNWFGFDFYEGRRRRYNKIAMSSRPMMKKESVGAPAPEMMETAEDAMVVMESTVAGLDVAGNTSEQEKENEEKEKTDFSEVAVRTNLDETVFFMPNVQTDEAGNITLKFKMNEALTRWNFLGLAHSKDLKFGLTTKEVVTQKDLMVVPNPPRFFREKDEVVFTAKVSNLTEKELEGEAVLQLFDALTMKPIDALLGNSDNVISFSVKEGQSSPLAWKLKVPIGKVQAITHRVIAKAAGFSDGEESSLPVLTNRILVTEAKPLPVRGKETKEFTFQSLKNAASSSTLQHEKLTLEFTSNPAWYAVQALPYLMEYPYDCTEQIFSRYYANALASHVSSRHPKIRQVFDKWKNTDAMLSNLSKNQELKSALLEETPWVLNAQSEETQKKNIGLLFDLDRMAKEKDKAIRKIAERQLSNGGFSWFPGGRDSWYITQYILEGIGHMEALGVESSDRKIKELRSKAIGYVDARMLEYYEEIGKRVKKGLTKWENDHLSHIAIHYLYTRSFFLEKYPLKGKNKTVLDYFLGQADKYWTNRGLYAQGMLALASHRTQSGETAKNIMVSLKERSLNSEELGMYWKYDTGYYWYQLPIETHALMIEAFDEIEKDAKAVDDLKVWLLKNKQTNHWRTTKATASATYVLLLRGDNWLMDDNIVEVSLGDKVKLGGGKISAAKNDNIVYEPGTGYFKTSWKGEDINSDMANIKVKNSNNVVAWGALYWQYFEDLDKVKTFEETPLTIKKKLFKEVNTNKGPELKPLGENTTLQVGDKVKVRIEIRVDRDMEYVHMKDMRASGFEPINVLSQYKWQGGLGYYESTKDASTNFFISRLPKGTYVFEYPLRVQHQGDFSNGLTTLQCMYAPEYTSHSEGIRVEVK